MATNRNMRTVRFRAIADFAVTTVLGAAAILVIWRTIAPPTSAGGPPPREAVENVRAQKLSTSTSGLDITGNVSAPVVLIEFSDFECPFCEKYSQEVFELVDRHFVATGRLRYAFRHFPLENIHPNALAAAQAAECASRQGKFWEMHHLLFTRRKDLEQHFWRDETPSIGLAPAAFADCLEGSALPRIRSDIAEGRRLGIDSTPTFLIGRTRPDGSVSIATKIRGAQPYEVFERVIKESF